MKRPMIFLLLFILLAGGCSKVKNEENKEVTTFAEGEVLRVGDSQTDYHEALVYLDAVRRDYERYYGPDIWKYRVDGSGDDIADKVREEVLVSLICMKTVCLRANELNVLLSEEELRVMDQKAADYMKSISGSKLTAQGVNESVVRRVYTDNALALKVYERVTMNADAEHRQETFDRCYSEWAKETKVAVNDALWNTLEIE